MNTQSRQQLSNSTNHEQDQLFPDLIKSQALLNHLKQLVRESKSFNKSAFEYLLNSAKKLAR